MDGLRFRRVKTGGEASGKDKETQMGDNAGPDGNCVDLPNTSQLGLGTNHVGLHSYWLTRIVFLRSLAFVYFVAFLVALHQNKALVGKEGLLPIPLYLDRIRNYVKASKGEVTQEALNFAPTLLWFVDLEQDLDWWLDAIAYAGLSLSGMVLVMGCSNMIVMFVLWVLYHSLVNVGQRWLGVPTARNGFPCHLPVPSSGPETLPSAHPDTLGDRLGLQVAANQNHVGSRPD